MPILEWLPDIEGLYHAADELFADKSDWLPYFGLAEGIVDAGDNLYSRISGAYGYQRDKLKTISEQITQANWRVTANIFLIWSSTYKPFWLPALFIIKTCLDACLAMFDYGRLAFLGENSFKSKLKNNCSWLANRGLDGLYNQELQKNKNILIAKIIAIGCWLLAAAFNPNALLYIALAATFSVTTYQRAKHSITKNPESFFNCCKVVKKPTSPRSPLSLFQISFPT